MRFNEFKASLRATRIALGELGILESTLHMDGLTPCRECIDYARRGDCVYRQLYLMGLQHRDYVFLLADRAFLQFGYWETDAGCGLRYALYPNPFEFLSMDEYVARVQDGETDEIGARYDEFLSTLGERSHRPMVRYDVDRASYQKGRHPAAHVHFGLHVDGRWPVKRILTPIAFALFMAKLWYPDAWWAAGHDGAAAYAGNLWEERLCREVGDCTCLEGSHFEREEAEQIHVT